jgi:hypothetical protein
MDYDSAYSQAAKWLKRNPGKNRKVISSANGFQVVEGEKVLMEFKVDEKKKD